MKLKIASFCMCFLVILVATLGTTLTAFAMPAESSSESLYVDNGATAEPNALFVDVTIGLNGENGAVWSIATVKAAVFATTIQVIVELYYSYTYQESYLDMILYKRVKAGNLKLGESVKAVGSTNGEQKYWKGRAYFKADSADWKFGVTKTLLLDENGILVL